MNQQITMDDVFQEQVKVERESKLVEATSKARVHTAKKFNNEEIELINEHIELWNEYEMRSSNPNNRHFIINDWKVGQCEYVPSKPTKHINFYYPNDDGDSRHGNIAIMVWITKWDKSFSWMTPKVLYDTKKLV